MIVSVAVPEPEIPLPSVRFVQVVPPFVETCHWNVGAGLPEAATVKVAVDPASTVTEVACVVIESTVNVAGVLVSVPWKSETIAWYS
jgi:hypothetical protein